MYCNDGMGRCVKIKNDDALSESEKRAHGISE